MAASDADLVARARRGDRAAFDELYRRHRDFVGAVAMRFLGDRDEANDVVQETFVVLLQKLPDLVLRAQLRTYLYPVAKHRALDRKRKRRPGPLPEGAGDAFAAAPAGLPGGLADLIDGLAPLAREVLWLRFADGLALKEIAAALDVPLGTVKSRLHHALEAARKKLEDG